MAVFQNAHRIGTGQGGFVQTTGSVNHHSPVLPQRTQSLSHRVKQVIGRNAEHLAIGPQGIHERTKQVENRSHSEALAQRSEIHQCGMPGRCEQKGHPGGWESLHYLCSGSLEMKTQPFENVGRTDLAAGTSVSVFRASKVKVLGV